MAQQDFLEVLNTAEDQLVRLPCAVSAHNRAVRELPRLQSSVPKVSLFGFQVGDVEVSHILVVIRPEPRVVRK